MIPRPHRLATSDLAALSHGGGGTAAMHALVSARHSRTLLLIRYIAGIAGDDAHVRRAYEALKQVQRMAPRAFKQVIGHPLVGAWATRTAMRLAQGQPATPAELACVAIAAAVRGRIDMTVTVPAMERLCLPSLGAVLRPVLGEIVVLCGDDGTDLGDGIRIPLCWSDEAPAWRPVPQIAVSSAGMRATFLLGLGSSDGLPAGLRVSDSLDVPLWRDLISRGWDLLVRHHREVAEELAASITVLTPLHTVPTGMTSATLDDAFGCLFLSSAPNVQSIGVTLAHELQHTKLIALMDLFPLLEPVPGERFYAPWRNDPRPLTGLLHGTYAYTGVTAFWWRQRECETSLAAETYAHTEFARWRSATREAAGSLLDSGRLTPVGNKFVAGITDVLDQWCTEPVPAPARRRAMQLSREHRSQWFTRYVPP